MTYTQKLGFKRLPNDTDEETRILEERFLNDNHFIRFYESEFSETSFQNIELYYPEQFIYSRTLDAHFVASSLTKTITVNDLKIFQKRGHTLAIDLHKSFVRNVSFDLDCLFCAKHKAKYQIVEDEINICNRTSQCFANNQDNIGHLYSLLEIFVTILKKNNENLQFCVFKRNCGYHVYTNLLTTISTHYMYKQLFVTKSNHLKSNLIIELPHFLPLPYSAKNIDRVYEPLNLSDLSNNPIAKDETNALFASVFVNTDNCPIAEALPNVERYYRHCYEIFKVTSDILGKKQIVKFIVDDELFANQYAGLVNFGTENIRQKLQNYKNQFNNIYLVTTTKFVLELNSNYPTRVPQQLLTLPYIIEQNKQVFENFLYVSLQKYLNNLNEYRKNFYKLETSTATSPDAASSCVSDNNIIETEPTAVSTMVSNSSLVTKKKLKTLPSSSSSSSVSSFLSLVNGNDSGSSGYQSTSGTENSGFQLFSYQSPIINKNQQSTKTQQQQSQQRQPQQQQHLQQQQQQFQLQVRDVIRTDDTDNDTDDLNGLIKQLRDDRRLLSDDNCKRDADYKPLKAHSKIDIANICKTGSLVRDINGVPDYENISSKLKFKFPIIVTTECFNNAVEYAPRELDDENTLILDTVTRGYISVDKHLKSTVETNAYTRRDFAMILVKYIDQLLDFFDEFSRKCFTTETLNQVILAKKFKTDPQYLDKTKNGIDSDDSDIGKSFENLLTEIEIDLKKQAVNKIKNVVISENEITTNGANNRTNTDDGTDITSNHSDDDSDSDSDSDNSQEKSNENSQIIKKATIIDKFKYLFDDEWQPKNKIQVFVIESALRFGGLMLQHYIVMLHLAIGSIEINEFRILINYLFYSCAKKDASVSRLLNMYCEAIRNDYSTEKWVCGLRMLGYWSRYNLSVSKSIDEIVDDILKIELQVEKPQDFANRLLDQNTRNKNLSLFAEKFKKIVQDLRLIIKSGNSENWYIYCKTGEHKSHKLPLTNSITFVHSWLSFFSKTFIRNFIETDATGFGTQKWTSSCVNHFATTVGIFNVITGLYCLKLPILRFDKYRYLAVWPIEREKNQYESQNLDILRIRKEVVMPIVSKFFNNISPIFFHFQVIPALIQLKHAFNISDKNIYKTLKILRNHTQIDTLINLIEYYPLPPNYIYFLAYLYYHVDVKTFTNYKSLSRYVFPNHTNPTPSQWYSYFTKIVGKYLPPHTYLFQDDKRSLDEECSYFTKLKASATATNDDSTFTNLMAVDDYGNCELSEDGYVIDDSDDEDDTMIEHIELETRILNKELEQNEESSTSPKRRRTSSKTSENEESGENDNNSSFINLQQTKRYKKIFMTLNYRDIYNNWSEYDNNRYKFKSHLKRLLYVKAQSDVFIANEQRRLREKPQETMVDEILHEPNESIIPISFDWLNLINEYTLTFMTIIGVSFMRCLDFRPLVEAFFCLDREHQFLQAVKELINSREEELSKLESTESTDNNVQEPSFGPIMSPRSDTDPETGTDTISITEKRNRLNRDINFFRDSKNNISFPPQDKMCFMPYPTKAFDHVRLFERYESTGKCFSNIIYPKIERYIIESPLNPKIDKLISLKRQRHINTINSISTFEQNLIKTLIQLSMMCSFNPEKTRELLRVLSNIQFVYNVLKKIFVFFGQKNAGKSHLTKAIIAALQPLVGAHKDLEEACNRGNVSTHNTCLILVELTTANAETLKTISGNDEESGKQFHRQDYELRGSQSWIFAGTNNLIKFVKRNYKRENMIDSTTIDRIHTLMLDGIQINETDSQIDRDSLFVMLSNSQFFLGSNSIPISEIGLSLSWISYAVYNLIRDSRFYPVINNNFTDVVNYKHMIYIQNNELYGFLTMCGISEEKNFHMLATDLEDMVSRNISSTRQSRYNMTMPKFRDLYHEHFKSHLPKSGIIENLHSMVFIKHVKNNMATIHHPTKHIKLSELNQRLLVYSSPLDRDNAQRFFQRHNTVFDSKRQVFPNTQFVSPIAESYSGNKISFEIYKQQSNLLSNSDISRCTSPTHSIRSQDSTSYESHTDFEDSMSIGRSQSLNSRKRSSNGLFSNSNKQKTRNLNLPHGSGVDVFNVQKRLNDIINK